MAGRKSKYDEGKLVLVEGWARDGLSEEQIAHNLAVSHETIRQWKLAHPEFLAAITHAKEIVDREVENALLKRALGYNYDEDVATPQGGVVTVTKHLPPDVKAATWWLQNRKPADYRNRQEVTGPNGGPLQVTLADLVAAAADESG